MSTDLKAAVAQVKAAYQISDYILSRGIELKPNGIDKWKACCPFHKEKTPSFSVNDNFQNYHCFGCGVNGDILSFAINYENLSFSDALRKLAEDKNIVLDVDAADNNIDYDSLRKIVKTAAVFYCRKFDELPDDHKAKTEITQRGLRYDNTDDILPKYGYSPSGNQLYKFLIKSGFSEELILETGLCRKNDATNSVFDFFRSRLMFVFSDRYGRPIGFSSRKLFEDDDRGKYVNSAESPLFYKTQVFYNHAKARKFALKEKDLYVCEGQFDVAAFMESGLLNVVATSGTAFTREHVKECRKMVGDSGRVIFCFDGDAAGIKAAEKVFLEFPEIHENGYVVIFPDNQDPCDYRLEHGSEKLVEYVAEPRSLVEFILLHAKERYDVHDPVSRAKYISHSASLIKSIPNLALRESCIRLLSLESLTSIDIIRETVKEATPQITASEPDETVDVAAFIETDEKKKHEVDEIAGFIRSDLWYRTSAQFISLGLSRKAWRSAVLRSKNLFPSDFEVFLSELDSIESDSVFPEMFNEYELAKMLMSFNFSGFYKFMSNDELKEHFVYLHERLVAMQENDQEDRINAKIQELLQKDETGSVEYFEKLMKKMGALKSS